MNLRLRALVAVLIAGVTSLLNPATSRAESWSEFSRVPANTSASTETWLTKMNATTLEEKWAAQVGNAVDSAPAVVNDTVYVGTLGNEVLCLALTDGHIIWRTPVAGQVYGTPLYVNGRLYVGDLACTITCLAARTGAVLWSKQVGNPAVDGFFGSAKIARGRILLGVSNHVGDAPCSRGRLVALSAATGDSSWTWYAVDASSTGGGIWNTVAVDDSAGVVYVCPSNPCTGNPSVYTDAFVCLDATNGHVLWSYQVLPIDTSDYGFGSSPCLFSAGTVRGVAAGQKNGNLYAVNRATQTLLWKTPLALPTDGGGDIGIIAAPAVWGDLIIVPTGKTTDGYPGSIAAVRASNGTLVWRHHTPGPIFGPAVVANGVVLATNGTPTLIALDAATGDSLAGVALDAGPVFGGPSVSHGYVLMPTFNYRLHALSLPAVPAAVRADRARMSAGATPRLDARVRASGEVEFEVRGDVSPGEAVQILDATGRLIATLPLRATGEHASAFWTGADARGRRVSRGVYVARLVQGGASVRVVRVEIK
jgi:outer membrane protein assembly factor BamB